MADSPLAAGIPDVGPAQAPAPFQSVQPLASEAMSQAGESALQTSKFFGQAAADNAFNDYQDYATKLLYGDPNKTVTMPDGSSAPDTGFFGLKGRAALDARPGIEAQLDEKLNEIRQGLQTPEQVQQFETYSRRYRAAYSGDIGRFTDQQSTAWYGDVNTASANNALNAISNDPLNPRTILNGTSDLVNARIKQAQLAGAQPGDEVWNSTIEAAKSDAIKAQVLSIGTTDPAKAVDILKKNQSIVDAKEYPVLYNDLRARADQQSGQEFGDQVLQGINTTAAQNAATSYANPALPVYQQTVTSIPGGMSSAGLARTVQIESGGDPNVVNASGHTGLGQFSDETWKEYGNGGDPKNPADSIAAIQRMAAANAQILTRGLERPPTDAELYLAHQQGAGGALKLLQNPDAPAAALVGAPAILQNGGTQGMTARQFTTYWGQRFANISAPAPAGVPAAAAPPTQDSEMPVQPQDGVLPETPSAPTATPPVPTVSPKAQAYQMIEANPDLTPQAKAHAFAYVSQQLQAQAIAASATDAQIKQASDKAADGYMTQILGGQVTPDMQQRIANDPNLTWETKKSLVDALEQHATMNSVAASAAYGPGFWKVYQQVSAPAGDPSRISDVSELLKRAGPGGDLTLAGVQEAKSIMDMNQKSIDGDGLNQARTAMLNYAKSKLSFDTTGEPLVPGVTPLRDPEGEMLFNARFVPRFMAAFNKWVQDGKDPYEFLTQDNVDKMVAGLRSPREMSMAKLSAAEGVNVSSLPAPPAPQGVDPDGWKMAFNSLPAFKLSDGSSLAPDKWAGILQTLAANPDAATRKAFDSHFGSIMSADAVLDVMGIRPSPWKESFEDEMNAAKPAPPAPKPPVQAYQDQNDQIIRDLANLPPEPVK